MNWNPSTGCPIPHSPDHETLVSGPYAPGTSLKPTGSYPHIVYYCSQNVLQAAGAFCGHSEDGGVTFDAPSTMIFGATSQCGALHGHFRISPDGTGYVPQNNCKRADGVAGQGMAVTKDNGQTYTYSVVPDSSRNGTGGDPSVAADAANKVYYGYVGADGHAKIATSTDHGATWAKSIDVGSAFHIEQAEFPEVITGDSGRAAFAFLGASALGNDQAPDYPGAWYMFVAYTYDGGATWQVTNATPNDPVQRGCVDNGGTVGGTCSAGSQGDGSQRNMLDFNGIDVDKHGRPDLRPRPLRHLRPRLQRRLELRRHHRRDQQRWRHRQRQRWRGQRRGHFQPTGGWWRRIDSKHQPRWRATAAGSRFDRSRAADRGGRDRHPAAGEALRLAHSKYGRVGSPAAEYEAPSSARRG